MMEAIMKRLVVLMLTIWAAVLAGCNTVQGFLFGRPMLMKDLVCSMRNGPSIGAQYAIPFAANN